jgi:hypothetical protein
VVSTVYALWSVVCGLCCVPVVFVFGCVCHIPHVLATYCICTGTTYRVLHTAHAQCTFFFYAAFVLRSGSGSLFALGFLVLRLAELGIAVVTAELLAVYGLFLFNGPLPPGLRAWADELLLLFVIWELKRGGAALMWAAPSRRRCR